jgi:hypothetical protein
MAYRPQPKSSTILTLRASLLLTDQFAAAIEGFFWPKIFWDFLTKNLDGAVKPFPSLQIVNLVLALVAVAWEWPLKYLAGTGVHRSFEARIVIYSLSSLAAVLLYQGTNPALYYLIAIGVYLWAYIEGEVSPSSMLHLPNPLCRPVPFDLVEGPVSLTLLPASSPSVLNRGQYPKGNGRRQ